MFGREFVLQCWRKSFRKMRCSLLWFFFGCVPECLWLLCCTLISLLMKFLSLLLIKKKKIERIQAEPVEGKRKFIYLGDGKLFPLYLSLSLGFVVLSYLC